MCETKIHINIFIDVKYRWTVFGVRSDVIKIGVLNTKSHKSCKNVKHRYPLFKGWHVD